MTGTTRPDSIWQGCQTWQEKVEGLYILKDCIFLIYPISFTVWKVPNDASNDVVMKRITAWKAPYIFSRIHIVTLWNVSANNAACPSVAFITPIYYKQRTTDPVMWAV